MIRGGVLQHKCRQCGITYKSVHVPDINQALICLADNLPFPKGWGGISVKIHDIHNCNQGVLGISDLICGIEDKERS